LLYDVEFSIPNRVLQLDATVYFTEVTYISALENKKY